MERINAAVRKVLAEPVVQERLARVGVEAATLPGQIKEGDRYDSHS